MTTSYRTNATTIPTIDKSLTADLDYQFDWSDWLTDTETIASKLVTVQSGITASSAATNTDTTVTVWLAGGDLGGVYVITCEITTSMGRTDERSIQVNVIQR